MNESLNTGVLAIDGGGSRCRIGFEQGGQITRVETGSANVYSDFDGAVLQIRKGLNELAVKVGLDDVALAQLPAFVGLAGVVSETVTARLRAALPFRRMRIEDDRPAALRGALGAVDGAIIHCGTGSFFALQRSGQARFAGGWGPILDDKASAKWIGWAALNAALRVKDGTLPDNVWALALIEEMGGIEAVLAFATSATPADFGRIGPQVTAAAAKGDPLALSILRQGASHVVDAIVALGWSEGMALCLTGGVAPFYREHLPKALADAVCNPMGEPLDGALSLAREVPA